jgi:hypothetical protein
VVQPGCCAGSKDSDYLALDLTNIVTRSVDQTPEQRIHTKTRRCGDRPHLRVDAASKERRLLINFVEPSRGFVLLERMTSVLERRNGQTICGRTFWPTAVNNVIGLAPRASFSSMPGAFLFDSGHVSTPYAKGNAAAHD